MAIRTTSSTPCARRERSTNPELADPLAHRRQKRRGSGRREDDAARGLSRSRFRVVKEKTIRMSTRKSTPSSMSHTHGEHCEACGHHLLVERRYSINDRFARALFASVCRSMDLVPTAASKRPGAQIGFVPPMPRRTIACWPASTRCCPCWMTSWLPCPRTSSTSISASISEPPAQAADAVMQGSAAAGGRGGGRHPRPSGSTLPPGRSAVRAAASLLRRDRGGTAHLSLAAPTSPRHRREVRGGLPALRRARPSRQRTHTHTPGASATTDTAVPRYQISFPTGVVVCCEGPVDRADLDTILAAIREAASC